jgi:hypothetical protein
MAYFTEPYEYDQKTVDEVFNDNDDNLGNYRIGHYEKNKFIVTYIGKGNIKVRLKVHFEDDNHDDYFTFSVEDDEVKMSEQECKDYHRYKPIKEGGTLNNDLHPPVLPKGTKCLICKQ